MIPAIQKDVGGTLSFDVPESGTISAAHVAIYDPRGAEIRAESAANFDDAARVISTAIAPEEAAELYLPSSHGAYQYQARWRYTVGAVELRRLQIFEVRRYVAYCPLTSAKLETYDPLIRDRIWPGQVDWSPQIRLAWERDVCGTIRAKGRNPHLVRDVDALEEATALFALSRIYGGWGASYANQAAAYKDSAAAALGQQFGALDWYDENEDLVPDDAERRRPVWSIRCTR